MAAQLQLRNAGCHGFGAVKDRAACGKLAMGFRSINRAMMLLKKRLSREVTLVTNFRKQKEKPDKTTKG